MAFSTEVRERREFVSEIKFLIPVARTAALREWARDRLYGDPHGGGPNGDTYHTASLYFDTHHFDVYHRRGSFGRSKYRIRRYDAAGRVFLERKLKTQNWVGKRRSLVTMEELPRLCELEAEHGWGGYWFHRRLLARELHLVCQVSYARTALIGGGLDPIRLTLDEDVRAVRAADLRFSVRTAGLLLSGSHAILELKYRTTLPPVFAELIDKFSLTPQPISKYRMAVASLGVVGESHASGTALPVHA